MLKEAREEQSERKERNEMERDGPFCLDEGFVMTPKVEGKSREMLEGIGVSEDSKSTVKSLAQSPFSPSRFSPPCGP